MLFLLLQGWLNDAQTRLVLDDEKDEMDYHPLKGHTRTIVWVSECYGVMWCCVNPFDNIFWYCFLLVAGRGVFGFSFHHWKRRLR